MLEGAGFRSRVIDDIRSEIWLKAWGNLSFNPISALTQATLVDICQFGETRQLAAAMMGEAQTIAEKLGVTFRHTKLLGDYDGAERHSVVVLPQTRRAVRRPAPRAVFG